MGRPKILVFQHVPYEPLGTLDPLLKASGCRLRYLNFSRQPHARPKVRKYDALIVLGGPMNADQVNTHAYLNTEVELIREALSADVAVLGICLGAQLLAKAIGGRVRRNPVREIGWYDVELTETGASDPVLASFAKRQEVFQWHEDGIELPPETELLARSTASEVQAFRYGRSAYGFQFHLEASAALIERWLEVPAHAEVLEEERSSIDPEAIRARTPEAIVALEGLSRTTFSRWIEQFEPAPRRRPLPSR